MSTQPETLDRSVLERKARDELQQIAGAIGASVNSRAKKADIVDAILAAAGGTGDQSSPEGPASSDNGSSRPRTRVRSAGNLFDADDLDVAVDSSPAVPEPEVKVPDVETPDEEPKAEWELAMEADQPDQAGSAGPANGVEVASSSGGGRSGDPSNEDGPKRRVRTVGKSDDAAAPEAKQSGAENRSGSGAESSGGSNQSGSNQSGSNQAGSGQQANRQSGDSSSAKSGSTGPNNSGADSGNDASNSDGDDQGDSNNKRRRRRRGREREPREEQFTGDPVEVEGIVDLRDEGYGFLRTKGFLPSKEDCYLPAKLVRQHGLRKGDTITGTSRPANRSEKNPALLRVDTVNGIDPEEAKKRPRFENLTPLFPDEKLRLELTSDPSNMTARIIDLVSPIGKGQRGLIVSPPKAGKTTVMKQIAQSIETNNPEVELIVLLIDERPEEVTDMRRSVRGTVVASTFDRPSDEHTQVAEVTIERAKRMVEEGKDVVIILDGITRLARAYNLAAPATGRIMSGGIDTGALYPPKKFFGAARNVEEGGSLTILATALIETGSKMDEVIFEEFKGTGNMELRLDRRLAERRVYPAIDVDSSSTRHEELLFERKQLQQVWKLRRVLSGLSGGDGEGRSGAGLELLVDRLKTFRNNDEFLAEIAKAPSL